MYILICTIRAYVLTVPHVEHKVLLRGTPECWIALQQKRLTWFELLEPTVQLFLSLFFHKWYTPFQQTDAVLYEMSIKSLGGVSERQSASGSLSERKKNHSMCGSAGRLPLFVEEY